LSQQSQPRTEWIEETVSTNEDARLRAEAGERGPLWIAARRQSGGRGRRGRTWEGLDGNLFATGLYTMAPSPGRAAQLSFIAALAVASVCDKAGIDDRRTKLKWPNDVLVDGAKTAGILLESGSTPGGDLWLAVGIGVNLVASPKDMPQSVTHLSANGGHVDRETALIQLAENFDDWRSRWLRDGFGVIRDAWLSRAYGLGERCIARLAAETLEGQFADLGPDGALRLDLDGGGRRYISAGEVFFPSSDL
jgi:BirA family biotin operon repressor/biotin-[acetyl-CoA-carboxylase] ligase